MRLGISTAVVIAALLAGPVALSAEGEKEIKLKDGTTLVIFKDGKMSMRDAKGRPVSMRENHPMETRDGKVIMMRGNELWRKTQSEKEIEDLYRGG